MSEENKNIEREQTPEHIPKETTPVDDRIASQSTEPSDEATTVDKPQAGQTETSVTTTKPQTQIMEVHHHSHSHGKKNWKSYFWEFLMLFLAVFCGFLAEYQLEHLIEHQREKKYMQSLLSDLSADTATLNAAYPRKDGRVKAIDSVFIFFNIHPDAKKISGQLFRTIRRTNYDVRFTRTNITFNQLKNAGGMRLVQNKQVADSISAYDLYCEQSELYYQLYNTISQLGARQFEKLFNAADLLPFYIANTSGGIVANIPDTIVIRINTTELNEQLNFMMQEKAYARQETNLCKGVQSGAERLMELIRKEYHLE